MNRIRRRELQALLDQIEEVREALEVIKEEEECYRENMPENLQSSARAETADEAISNMESALDELDSVFSSIESAMGEQ